ncbi:MAG: PEP-CTERM sorting domain-containing protein [Halioglobus sp.]|nr:PEP-CTERM sorting domain-containing protein [Halioglobus sp.]
MRRYRQCCSRPRCFLPCGSRGIHVHECRSWASLQDVQALFNSFTGQSTVAPGYYHEAGSTWAPLFLSSFNPVQVFSRARLVTGYTCTYGGDNWAWSPKLWDRDPYDDSVETNSSYGGQAWDGAGAWFVRPAAQVPAPATLALLGMGLAALGVFGRKRAAKV